LRTSVPSRARDWPRSCCIFDSRDQATQARLEDLGGAYRLFRCRTIRNCSEVCPKGLEPAHAIEMVRLKMVKKDGDSGALPTHPARPVR
jgi:succinate dehydrogenase / fumarate reductase iron-sulfur subunit